ncbi:Energy-coupling factor transporter ATP-binding protein EcfA2 [compost metagenome]
MRQRLAIAVALAGDPDFLVLDEPINGLDPQGIIEMRELLLKLNKERQITILISSHILDELSRLATHYGFVDHGQMVKEISAAELQAACRKCTQLKVSDTGVLARVLDQRGMEYSIRTQNEAEMYGILNVTDLVMELAKNNCEVFSMSERDESLESYFIGLTGGGEVE